MTAVAGLDLSLRAAGVAVVDGSQVHCYTFGYDLTKKSRERDRLERLVFVTNQVMGALRRHEVRQVAVENYGFASHTLAFSAELGGAVKVQLWAGLAVMPLVIPATSVRRYHLGDQKNKDKKKLDMHLRGLGFTQPTNFDESDALALALIARDYFQGREGICTSHRLDLFERLDRQR